MDKLWQQLTPRGAKAAQQTAGAPRSHNEGRASPRLLACRDIDLCYGTRRGAVGRFNLGDARREALREQRRCAKTEDSRCRGQQI